MAKFDTYQDVTDAIIAQLETGTRFYWPFMYTSLLSDNDCREDLLAIQRAKLARFHAHKPVAPKGAQLALFVEA